MKRKFLFVTIGVVAVFLVAAFLAGKTFASVGCFSDTNGHWAETYICWLKDNGISSGYGDGTYHPESNITRAEMAVMLKAQAQVPPSAGLILVTPGFGGWLKFHPADDISFDNYSNATIVVKTTPGEPYLSIQPSIPTVLYGRSLQLVGVEFCYDGAVGTYLSYVEINTFTSTAGELGSNHRYSDITDRTDAACRYYVLPAPVTLTAEDGVNFFIAVHWNAGGTGFSLSRTTFVLQPTGTIAALPKSFLDNVVTLSETKPTEEGASTTAPAVTLETKPPEESTSTTAP